MLSVNSIAFLVALFLSYRIGLIVYRLFFHPLAAFPGPRLAAITSLYESYFDVWVPPGGQMMLKLRELHEVYGPVIRVTPDDIHIHDPYFHSQVFSYQGRWDKHPKYQRFGNPTSHFATLDHDLHKLRRNALVPFFSKTKIQELEPRIQRNVDKLCTRLKSLERVPGSHDAEPLDLRTAFGAFAKDTVFEYATARSAGALDHPTWDAPFMQLTHNMAPIYHLSKQLTWLPALFNSLPLKVIQILDSAAAEQKKFQLDLHAEITTIMKKIREEKGESAKQGSRTIITEVMSGNALPEHEMTPERMTDELYSFTIAGTDTMAMSMMVTSYHILKNDRDILRKIREELSQVPKPWTLQKLESLPYLTGVIQEGLRLAIGSTLRLGRIAPDRDIIYPGPSELSRGSKEWAIPAGTEISFNTMHIHYDERIWGADVREFKPERWMNSEERKRLSKFLVTFKSGTRGCMGMSLAYAEYYLAIANIYAGSDFDLHLHDASHDDMDILGDMVEPLLRKEAKVVVTAKGGVPAIQVLALNQNDGDALNELGMTHQYVVR